MREYLAQYNKTRKRKIVILKAQKKESELSDQIKLILDPDGCTPMHIDILWEDFLALNEPHDDKIYFIQDINPVNLENLSVSEFEDESEDYVIQQAINLIRDPRIQWALGKAESQP